MAQKKNSTSMINPLATMSLDDIVREETGNKPSPSNITTDKKQVLLENLEKYTGVKEQGVAVWIPKEVKKRLELARAKSEKNIPMRSLAAAIIMTYIQDVESVISEQ